MGESRRIAMFTDSYPPILNGVAVSVDGLVRELRRRGNSVDVYCPKFPGHRDTDPNVHRAFAIRSPWARDYPLAIPPYLRPLREFRRHEYDVVHSHTPFILGMVALRWAQSHELPIVTTYHTLYDRYAHYLAAFPRRYARYRIAKHTHFYMNSVDRVITPTEAGERWLRRHAVTTPVSVIPTGVPAGAPHERVESRRALGLHPEERVLLYVGRLAKEKNLDSLMDAAERAMRGRAARLVLVGDGPVRDRLHRLARELGIGDRVTITGLLPRDEVDRWYAAADLFVFASTTETQGLVIQEAMRYGLPAVLVQGGGAALAVEDRVNGLVCRSPDPEALGAMIREALDDDALLARLGKGAMIVARASSIEVMGERVVEVYESAIATTKNREVRHPDVSLR